MKLSKKNRANFFHALKLLYLLLILLILLTTATYTWFSLSRAPKINDMSLYVSTASGLEISYDLNAPDEGWGQNLIYSERYEENTVLRPITYVDEEDTFYAATMGTDGRIVAINHPLSDNRNANRNDVNGYYVKFVFYARTTDPVSVSLSNLEGEGSQGTYVVGMPEWNGEEVIHNDSGRGLHSAMRVGFRITRYDQTGAPLNEDPIFVIYEPNSNVHLDFSGEYRTTASITGKESLVPADRLIRQEGTAWLEADPVQKDLLIFKHGEFIDDPHLFDLNAHGKARIEVYLWLEGQDSDCNYETSEAAKILANILFYSETKKQSGMEGVQ